jgi:8-oxo-dGTP diphosphatase
LNWELPGGAAETGQSPDGTVLREILEETGLDAVVLHMTGYYYYYYYAAATSCTSCSLRGRDRDAVPRADLTEVSECRDWPRYALPRPISDFTVRRIEDAVAGSKFALPTHIGPRV